jgi:hypothetical protein
LSASLARFACNAPTHLREQARGWPLLFAFLNLNRPGGTVISALQFPHSTVMWL